VHAIVMHGYRVARRLIEHNREAVKRLAEELLVSESVDADGVRAILAGAMLEAAPTEAVH
jgi:ATP-dependent Zn protease